MQQGSLNFDDPPQENSIHVSHAQKRKGFRRKKGENPIEIQADLKMKKIKRQSNYTNPDAWARLVGRTNTAQSIWKDIWLLVFWIQVLNFL